MQIRSLPNNNGEMWVEGYATTFNQPYLLYKTDCYEVWEEIDRHAFDECDMTDVIMQHDHQGRVFARTRNKTLILTPKDYGLFSEAELSGTEIGKEVFGEIKGGYADRMSMGFVVGSDERTYTEDHENGKTVVLRKILKISKLYDVSVVSIPANDQTSISARGLGDGWIEEVKAERLRAQKRARLKLKMKMQEEN